MKKLCLLTCFGALATSIAPISMVGCSKNKIKIELSGQEGSSVSISETTAQFKQKCSLEIKYEPIANKQFCIDWIKIGNVEIKLQFDYLWKLVDGNKCLLTINEEAMNGNVLIHYSFVNNCAINFQPRHPSCEYYTRISYDSNPIENHDWSFMVIQQDMPVETMQFTIWYLTIAGEEISPDNILVKKINPYQFVYTIPGDLINGDINIEYDLIPREPTSAIMTQLIEGDDAPITGKKVVFENGCSESWVSSTDLLYQPQSFNIHVDKKDIDNFYFSKVLLEYQHKDGEEIKIDTIDLLNCTFEKTVFQWTLYSDEQTVNIIIGNESTGLTGLFSSLLPLDSSFKITNLYVYYNFMLTQNNINVKTNGSYIGINLTSYTSTITRGKEAEIECTFTSASKNGIPANCDIYVSKLYFKSNDQNKEDLIIPSLCYKWERRGNDSNIKIVISIPSNVLVPSKDYIDIYIDWEVKEANFETDTWDQVAYWAAKVNSEVSSTIDDFCNHYGKVSMDDFVGLIRKMYCWNTEYDVCVVDTLKDRVYNSSQLAPLTFMFMLPIQVTNIAVMAEYNMIWLPADNQFGFFDTPMQSFVHDTSSKSAYASIISNNFCFASHLPLKQVVKKSYVSTGYEDDDKFILESPEYLFLPSLSEIYTHEHLASHPHVNLYENEGSTYKYFEHENQCDWDQSQDGSHKSAILDFMTARETTSLFPTWPIWSRSIDFDHTTQGLMYWSATDPFGAGGGRANSSFNHLIMKPDGNSRCMSPLFCL